MDDRLTDLSFADWVRHLFDHQDPTQAFPVVPTNATIVSIALVFDEGSEVDPNGSPEMMLDNVFVNGRFSTRPQESASRPLVAARSGSVQ
jgi:hypothetical protein